VIYIYKKTNFTLYYKLLLLTLDNISIICYYFISKVENNALSEAGTGSCPAYEKHYACGIVFAFRCCKTDISYTLFAVILQKGIFL